MTSRLILTLLTCQTTLAFIVSFPSSKNLVKENAKPRTNTFRLFQSPKSGRNLQRTLRRDHCTQPTELQVGSGLYIYHLVDVDEKLETVTLVADFYYNWRDDCLWTKAVGNASPDINHISLDASQLPYEVSIVHLNSAVNLQAVKSNSYGFPVEIFHKNGQGLVERNSAGQWTTRCRSVEYRKFPFDGMHCVFTFLMWLTEDVATFVNAEINQANGVMPLESSKVPWGKAVYSANLSQLCYTMSDERRYCSSVANYSIILQRKWNYYLIQLFFPCIVLAIVLPASFLLSVQSTNISRISVQLSVTVSWVIMAQSQDYFTSPSQVILAHHMIFQAALSATCCILSCLVEEENNNRKNCLHKICLLRQPNVRAKAIYAQCPLFKSKTIPDLGTLEGEDLELSRSRIRSLINIKRPSHEASFINPQPARPEQLMSVANSSNSFGMAILIVLALSFVEHCIVMVSYLL